MITLENLRNYGAAVDEGLKRCLDDEDFYLELVRSTVADDRISELEQCLADKDLDKAFEVAHALKGMYGNISITPIYEPLSRITELLRERTDTDYSGLLAEARLQKQKLDKMNSPL
jgi:HPt (histidine-containing phosphotransfer) domain-containing protein